MSNTGDGTKEFPFGYFHPLIGKSSCGKETCENCNKTIRFGELWYCGYTHPYGSLFEVIKFSRCIKSKSGCSWDDKVCSTCKNACKKITATVCSECLATHDLCNYEVSADWTEHVEKYMRPHEKVKDVE